MIWPVCIIGAGAAGLMTAITAARSGSKVLLLDVREKFGAKIIMSGGTRCNLTNREVSEKDYASEQPNIVRAILRSYPSDKAVTFFKEIGVEVAEEPGIGKFFPVMESGQFVLEMLVKEARRLGVTIEAPRRVTNIARRPEAGGPSDTGHGARASGLFCISGENFEYQAEKIVLTTGGLSFPTTGSDGTGDRIVEALGHSMIPRSPSLTPLLTNDASWKKLSGVSLDVKITYLEGQKPLQSFAGSFLFTHLGFSGPVVLNVSRFWIRAKSQNKPRLVVNFLPASSEEKARKEIIQGHFLFPRQTIKAYLTRNLPERFVETIFEKCQVIESIQLCDLMKAERERILKELFRHELPVTGDRGYAKAEVTAGGVDLREIRKETMESRIVPGLYLAGEILDCDGRIGGFNFQWAWATGFLAGRAAAKT